MCVSQCRTYFVSPTFAAKESGKCRFQFTYIGRTQSIEWRLRKQNHGAHHTPLTCKSSLLSYSSASSSPSLRLWFTLGCLSYRSRISYKFTLAERMFFFFFLWSNMVPDAWTENLGNGRDVGISSCPQKSRKYIWNVIIHKYSWSY